MKNEVKTNNFLVELNDESNTVTVRDRNTLNVIFSSEATGRSRLAEVRDFLNNEFPLGFDFEKFVADNYSDIIKRLKNTLDAFFEEVNKRSSFYWKDERCKMRMEHIDDAFLENVYNIQCGPKRNFFSLETISFFVESYESKMFKGGVEDILGDEINERIVQYGNGELGERNPKRALDSMLDCLPEALWDRWLDYCNFMDKEFAPFYRKLKNGDALKNLTDIERYLSSYDPTLIGVLDVSMLSKYDQEEWSVHLVEYLNEYLCENCGVTIID